MRSLLELQQHFGAALTDPARAAGMPPGFSAYVRNVRGNWAGALASAYPALRGILGGASFDELAWDYARAHPSAGGDLNLFGGRLPDFLAADARSHTMPWLPDLATLEWLAHRCHYAPEASPPDLARLASMPPEACAQLRLSRTPASALYGSQWPLLRLWSGHPQGSPGEASVRIEPASELLLVHRPRWRVEVALLAPGDYRFLCEAGYRAKLGDALQSALHEDPAFDGASALARWVGAKAVTL